MKTQPFGDIWELGAGVRDGDRVVVVDHVLQKDLAMLKALKFANEFLILDLVAE